MGVVRSGFRSDDVTGFSETATDALFHTYRLPIDNFSLRVSSMFRCSLQTSARETGSNFHKLFDFRPSACQVFCGFMTISVAAETRIHKT